MSGILECSVCGVKTCERHNIVDYDICPYCEIDRLKEENECYRKALEKMQRYIDTYYYGLHSAGTQFKLLWDIADEALKEVQGE